MYWFWIITSVSIVVFAVTIQSDSEIYRGYKTIEIITTDGKSEDLVNSLSDFGVMIVLEPSVHRPAEIAVPPQKYAAVIKIIEDANLQYNIVNDDLQSVIDHEIEDNQRQRLSSRISSMYRFGEGVKESFQSITRYFPRNEEISDWMKKITSSYPETQIFTMGKTYEGRDQGGIIIGRNETSRKPAIWIQSGIHAREWATIPALLNVIYQLVSNPVNRDLVGRYEWYLVPVVNPDGYAFSHEEDRMWRKNRRPLETCTGVDLNRNWDYQWRENGEECWAIYGGKHAFSEPETRNIRDYVIKHLTGRLEFFLDLHAYGRFWFVPWSHNSTLKINDRDEQERVANAGSNGRFQVGTPGEILYNGSGTTLDWMRAVMHVKFSFAVEMSPSMGTDNGFIASPSQLPEFNEEIWTAIATAVRAMKQA